MGNHVVAKTKFWRYMREYHKIKKSIGQVFGVRELKERHPGTIKNFGIHLKFQSRKDQVNTSKEVRDTHLARAVSRRFGGWSPPISIPSVFPISSVFPNSSVFS